MSPTVVTKSPSGRLMSLSGETCDLLIVGSSAKATEASRLNIIMERQLSMVEDSRTKVDER